MNPRRFLAIASATLAGFTTGQTSDDSHLSPPPARSEPMVVVLVEFPDAKLTRDAAHWRRIVFTGQPGLRDYVREISYGSVDLVPASESHGVPDDGVVGPLFWGINRSEAPLDFRNRKLPEYLVDALADDLAWAKFDIDHDGRISTRELHLLIVAPGRLGPHNAEYAGGLQAHELVFFEQGHGSYQLISEEDSLATLAHEFLHGWGVLEGYNQFSDGPGGGGVWDIMFLEIAENAVPHPSAFSRCRAGLAKPKTIEHNVRGLRLPPVERFPAIYKIPLGSRSPHEYLLIENRQSIGYDDQLPSGGLLVWHVDDEVVEHALGRNFEDGIHQMDHFWCRLLAADGTPPGIHAPGDGSDPFPGSSGLRELGWGTSRPIVSFAGRPSGIRIENITQVGEDIRCDVIVEPRRPLLSVGPAVIQEIVGDGDQRPNVGETITLGLIVTNVGDRSSDSIRLSYHVSVGEKAASGKWPVGTLAPGETEALARPVRLNLLGLPPGDQSIAVTVTLPGATSPLTEQRIDVLPLTQFSDQTALRGVSLSKLVSFGNAVTDVNDDGLPDFVLAGKGTRHLLESRPGGRFDQRRLPGIPSGAYLVETIDLDNDGRLEIATWPWPGAREGVRVWQGSFAEGQEWREITSDLGLPPDPTTAAVWRDFDNDGWLDLVTVGPSCCVLYIGTGRTLRKKHDAGLPVDPHWSVFAADVDNDLDQDLLLLSHDMSGLRLFLNDGHGCFTDGTQSWALAPLSVVSPDAKCWAPRAAAWGDFDNDGWLDLFVATNEPDHTFLFRNAGGRRFEDVSARLGLAGGIRNGVAPLWLDIDHDGYLDLVLGSEHTLPAVYRNVRAERFEEIGKTAGLPLAHIVALDAADIDHDGDLDLLAASNRNDRHRLFVNRQNDDGFLFVRPVGSRCNRMAVGARVQLLEPSSGRLLGLRQIDSRSPEAHFGLSGTASVDVEVLFPNGLRVARKAARPGQRLTISDADAISDGPQ
jgi:M6 family metalloprotease-like protein